MAGQAITHLWKVVPNAQGIPQLYCTFEHPDNFIRGVAGGSDAYDELKADREMAKGKLQFRLSMPLTDTAVDYLLQGIAQGGATHHALDRDVMLNEMYLQQNYDLARLYLASLERREERGGTSLTVPPNKLEKTNTALKILGIYDALYTATGLHIDSKHQEKFRNAIGFTRENRHSTSRQQSFESDVPPAEDTPPITQAAATPPPPTPPAVTVAGVDAAQRSNSLFTLAKWLTEKVLKRIDRILGIHIRH